jgi:hypothetical protein
MRALLIMLTHYVLLNGWQMREDSKKGVYVENLTEMVVSSVQDVVLLLLKGASNRKVASTNMNRESSRSHSVFTCIIESKVCWTYISKMSSKFISIRWKSWKALGLLRYLIFLELQISFIG